MLSNLNKYKVILGSNSPRRRELLAGLDVSFDVQVIPGIEESYPESLKAEAVPEYLARKKAAAYMDMVSHSENVLLITADTIVWTFDEIMGKPADREEAIQMLLRLSEHVHEVVTGVCVMTKEKQVSFSVSTAVSFTKLSKEDIIYYVDKYRPFDKAGAYGVQEWIGYIGVEAINGSFYNVMGLPVQRLYKELLDF
ncbi:Maf-like protein [Parabacteroides sp. AM08-6]|uniref:Maf-like protein n=1 Tax=Parabacteroides sp. AM08-6 TaxID=2292053 RepID=UPI000EFDFC73|nr:Maf-like protein [Parabacteroides sp. AM08-6]RHJ78129.1 septum formation protein Maf [Parabacteroides sp. AM08-6]